MLALTLIPTIILPFLAARLAVAQPAWTTDPFEPAAIPLVVRTPYLSAWLAGGHALPDSWPTLYQGSILGWAGYVRVDGTAYRTMGLSNIDGQQIAEQLSVKITASTSEFTLRAGNVELLYTFLSPVELNDLTKLSLPLSYFSVAARSTDGSPHIVEVYADISAEWVTGDVKNKVQWGFDSTNDIVTHRIERTEQAKFHEIAEHAEHGATYFSTRRADGLTFAQGADVEQRTMFVKDGKLDNQADTEFRAAGDRWPVFGFANTFPSVSGNGQLSEPIVFSIGQFRDPIVQFVTKTGQPEERAPFWLTAYKTPLEAITFFLNDYAMAVSSAATLNNKISTDAATVSNNYVAILKLSLRQAVAAMELTVGRTNNVINPMDIMAFQKEISSNNNCNTVDVLFPQWPLFLYSNPAVGKALLEPLLRYAAMNLYPNRWAVHDLGSLYPNVTGHNDGKDEHMPIEESANMIIMALSYTQKTNDLSMIKQYFQNFDGWAQYLVATTLLPAEQLSTDDFSKPIGNHTNLAAKGIIGIAAMGEIAKLNGDAVKAERYTAIAKDMVPRWRALATSRDRTHLRLTYDDDASWGLMYNLYADKMLGLDLFPAEVYNLETAFYKTKLQNFGIILDTRANYTKSDWEIWVAAIADKELQTSLVDRVARYSSLADPKNAGMPFGDFYDVPTGSSRDFRARPVVGGHFAILALTSDPIGGGSTTTQSGSQPTGPTTGGGGPAGGQNGTPEIPDPNAGALPITVSRTALLFVLASVFLL